MSVRNRRITRISADISWKDIDIGELFEYGDLIRMLVKRYFSIIYKQTILGPLWIVITPLITTVMYSFVFGYIANIDTVGIPHVLFYMSGTTLWNLFQSSLLMSANTFLGNMDVFSKVYFPRLSAPIASTLCALLNYSIQFVMFLAVYFYYILTSDILQPNIALFFVPLLIIQAALLGASVGLIVASLTVKYRDLGVLISFAMQLWMYVTPIIYPMSAASGRTRVLLMLNPMAPIAEAFRYAFMGVGQFSPLFLGISAVVTVTLLFAAVLLFNKAEKTSVDTI